MGLQPKIIKERKFVLKRCNCCGNDFGPESYAPTKSFLYQDGVVPICDACIQKMLEENDFDWKIVNKLCQWVDVPFIPNEWERIRELSPNNVFHKYAEVFLGNEFDDLGWGDYYEKFKELKADGTINGELPLISDEQRTEYRNRWGAYDDDAYRYLEHLYSGLLTTQNVNGALQVDQAVKICKISYEIDKRIEEGTDFDKLLGSYDKLVKAADFTPKNVKNINDFDTTGELMKWMEKKHWKNNFFDDVTRDIVDETIQNFQNFNQRLYVNENGIGDEISRRIEALQSAKELEDGKGSYYGTDASYDLEQYDNDGYDALFNGGDDEFSATIEEG